MIPGSLDESWCVVDSPEALQAKVEILLDRPLLRRELVEMQKSVIRKRYRMSINLNNLFEILKDRLTE
jgi:hypothetical protein